MALIANSPNDLLDQLILLTRRLADLAERQASMFETNRFLEAQHLNEESARLAAVYAGESRRIAHDPSIVMGADLALREALTQETVRFKAAMEAHEKAIERQRVLAEGLVRAIAQEVVNVRPTPVAYGPGSTAYRDTSAVALDRTA
jgi:hypothetical protein